MYTEDLCTLMYVTYDFVIKRKEKKRIKRNRSLSSCKKEVSYGEHHSPCYHRIAQSLGLPWGSQLHDGFCCFSSIFVSQAERGRKEHWVCVQRYGGVCQERETFSEYASKLLLTFHQLVQPHGQIQLQGKVGNRGFIRYISPLGGNGLR